MWSVSPAEMVTIAIVALVVFGPKRLPEIARTAGRLARDLRKAAADLRSDIEGEYGDSLKPLEDARREMRTTMDSLKGSARSLDPLSRSRPSGPTVPARGKEPGDEPGGQPGNEPGGQPGNEPGNEPGDEPGEPGP